MGKNFNLTFNVNCLLGKNFNSSLIRARQGLADVRKEVNDLNKQKDKIGNQLFTSDISQKDWTAQSARIDARLKALKDKETQLNNVFTTRNKLNDATRSLSTFGLGVYAATRPLIGIVNTAAEFEAGMSKVQAISRASAEEMGLLTQQAKELGRTTQFTARQSADAMSYLGMAGWNAQEIMKGMPGLLDLAAAGGMDLARTADIVSDDLTAFGLSADQATHMADVFAYTITRTNTNVEMLGETMKYAAPVAHAFGASMEETAALAGLMANSGIKASQAGTALRMGFLRLAGPPKQAAKAMEALGMNLSEMSKQQAEAQAAMKALGIQMSDTNGPRQMSAIITELRNKLQGLNQKDRLATLGAIFGKNASTGWLAVIDAAPDKFDQLVNEMDKCDGEAKRLAKTMTSNAKGAMIRLKSATESAAIELGGVFLPILADAGDAAAEYVGVITKAASEHPELVKGIVLVTASMTAAVGVIKVANVAIAAYRAFSAAATAGTWGWNLALSANPIGLIVVAVTGLIAAGYMLYKNWDKVTAALVKGWNWVKDTAEGVVTAYINWWTDLPNKAAYAVGYVIGVFKTLPTRLMGLVENLGSVKDRFVKGATEWGELGLDGLIGAFKELPSKLGALVSSAWESAKSKITSIGVSFEAGTNAGMKRPEAALATGGIYNKGAFLTTFAEESGESAIPHTPTRRNIGLLAKTNEIMGNPLQPKIQLPSLDRIREIVREPVERISKSAPSIVFQPQITITGHADQEAVERALDISMEKFRAMFKQMQLEERRVSYG